MKLYLLSGGLLDADRSVIHPGDDSGKRVTLPVPQYLIEGDADGARPRRILIDTGVPPAAAGDPHALQREYEIDPAWLAPRIEADERVDRQLALLGLGIADLDLVINTHFHFDHAGGNALFAGVRIAAQTAELEAARSGGYLDVWDAEGLVFQPVEGDWSPLPGVEMLHTPGHSPGHQSMLVRLPGEPWLFTIDAVYTEEHWRRHKLGAVSAVAQARESIARLRRIAAEENARVIFGHDIAQWEALGMEQPGKPRLLGG
jgi:N-acyl homoserine lactone hydrolase